MKKIRIGIVGCGKIFPMHAYSIKKLEDVHLVAVCDSNLDRAKHWAKILNCNYYTDYKEMILKENLNSIHLCTPHYLHAEMAIWSANQGVHVYTEKPAAISLEDAMKMKEAKDNNKTLMVVSFQNRYNPGSMLIKEELESGKLGNVKYAKATLTWNRNQDYYNQSDWKGTLEKEGGGVVIDQAIHTLDLMHWFINKKLNTLWATIGNKAHPYIEVEDFANVYFEYEEGITSSLYAMNYYGEDEPIVLKIVCEHGTITLTGERAEVKYANGKTLWADRNPNLKFEFEGHKQYWGVGHMMAISDYYLNIKNKNQFPRNSIDEVMVTQEIVDAIYKSGYSNKRVNF